MEAGAVRLMRPSRRLQHFTRDGWLFERITGSGHLRMVHPAIPGQCMIIAATPGDRRSERNELARARRMLRQAEGVGR